MAVMVGLGVAVEPEQRVKAALGGVHFRCYPARSWAAPLSLVQSTVSWTSAKLSSSSRTLIAIPARAASRAISRATIKASTQ